MTASLPELTRLLSVLIFLAAITVIAELADRAGLFGVVARLAARAARGSVLGLWLVVVVITVCCTVTLSLDGAAVLITPVVLVLAARLALDRELFAYTVVWLANTASLILPMSNLTNLLAMSWLPRGAGGADLGTAAGYAGLVWPPALAAVIITTGALVVLFRRQLGGRYRIPTAEPVPDRALLIVAAVVCAALGPAVLLGLDVTITVVAGAALLLIATILRRPGSLRLGMLPWATLAAVAVLLLLAELAHRAGLGGALTVIAGSGDRPPDLFRLSGVAALGANLINNLPAYLALEPVADSPARVAALLIGVNAGPLITPWASVATVLWAGRCRAAGVRVDWSRFIGRGLLLVPVLLVGCTGASAAAAVLRH